MRQGACLLLLVLLAACLDGRATSLDASEEARSDRVHLQFQGAGVGLFELNLKPGVYDVEVSRFDGTSDDPLFGSQSFLYAYVYLAGSSPRASPGTWSELFTVPGHGWLLDDKVLAPVNVTTDDRVMVLVFSSLDSAAISLERVGSSSTSTSRFELPLSRDAWTPTVILGEPKIDPGTEQAIIIADRSIVAEALGTSTPRSVVAGINWYFTNSSAVAIREVGIQYHYEGEDGRGGHRMTNQDFGNGQLVFAARATVAYVSEVTEARTTTWVNETVTAGSSPVVVGALAMFLPVPTTAKRVEWSSAIEPSEERQSRRF